MNDIYTVIISIVISMLLIAIYNKARSIEIQLRKIKEILNMMNPSKEELELIKKRLKQIGERK